MKISVVAPKMVTITKWTGIAALFERLILLAFALFPFVYFAAGRPKLPIDTENLFVLSFFIAVVVFFSGYNFLKHQNYLLQLIWPHFSKHKKLWAFVLCLLIPIGEHHVLFNDFRKANVYTYKQYPRLIICPADIADAFGIESWEWWWNNDYTTYDIDIVEISEKGLNTISKLINKNSDFKSVIEKNKLTISTNNKIYSVSFAFEGFVIKNAENDTMVYAKEFATCDDAELETIAECIISNLKEEK